MIDKDKLVKLASDPELSTKQIFTALGFHNYATFSYQLNKDPEVKALFEAARQAASGERLSETNGGPPTSARKARRSSGPRAAAARNGHAKGRMSEELLRKVRLEFEHISLYDAVTEHFEELRKEVAAI